MRNGVPPPGRGGTRSAARDAAGVALVAIVAYLPVLWTGFTSDDFFILARLKEFGGLQHPLAYFNALGFFEYYRPLTFLSHALDWSVWGANPAGFHVTSLALHAANTALVYGLGRQFGNRPAAIVAGLLFALHPASHEAVYWMSARFDLLATCLTLVSALLILGTSRGYWPGVATFGLALLAKESAIALPVIVVAGDVMVRRLDARHTIRRLIPLLVVAGAYAALRSQAGALEVAGGASRLPKLVMLAAMVLALLWVAIARQGSRRGAGGSLLGKYAGALLVAGGAIAATLLLLPAASVWLRPKIGFASFALFYLVSPVAVPAPPSSLFDGPATLTAAIELVVLIGAVAVVWLNRRWLAARPPAVFLLVFVAAALAPVSSMTSGPRYLYLASAGASLFAGVVVWSLAGRARGRAIAVVAVALGLAAVQLVAAARSWTWATDMTRDAVELIRPALQPCGTEDVVLLTTPVGIRGVYSNFNEAALELSGCAPASFATLLRVQSVDAHVDVARQGDTIELRVPGYAGNFVASQDLRVFDAPIAVNQALTIDTPVGRLETTGASGVRVFRLSVAESKRGARFFYYSDGAVHALNF
ncbi:MAG: hypothetical protein ACHQO8_00180 [Vicinamibacterales bacterium]